MSAPIVVLALEAKSGEGGTADVLRALGAEVLSRDLFAPPSLVEGARVLVVDAGERLDLAQAALRALRKEEELRSVPALLVVTERQVTRVEPQLGFDDFVMAPILPAEIYARIRKLEWRASAFSTEELLKVGDIYVDCASRDVTVDGRPVTLTTREYELLVFFLKNQGRVLSRDRILRAVWGPGYEGGDRTVDIHVRRLRAKLGPSFALETLRGAGYKPLAQARVRGKKR
ncbi:MAG: response regulator transcription factor [Polyangiaceae bacterium]|nr:response regulator transcription factor [Polyangiaceae bacterium]